MKIEERDVKKYLEAAKNIKNGYEIYDTHVHPFELIFNQFEYQANPNKPDLYGIKGAKYIPPEISSILLSTNDDKDSLTSKWQNKIFHLMIRRLYGHSGPKVFGDHMELSGIDKSILLPVTQPNESTDPMMLLMAKMFGKDKRFLMSGVISNFIKNEQIKQKIKELIEQFGIRAMKFHPNVTEVDLNTSYGKERTEAILCACGECGLPLIIHGGRSSILKNTEAATYSSIYNLECINWGVSQDTVIIAHAGAYSCELQELENEILPRLNKMLLKYDNLMIDVSALDIEALTLVLKNIELERVLFGSDALYETQWFAVVKLLYVLSGMTADSEKDFIQIAAINPSRLFN